MVALGRLATVAPICFGGSMKSFFSALGRFFKRLFSKETTEAIGRYVEAATPIVEMIAMMTPTRADDEILALLKALKREGLFDPAIPREDILRRVAVSMLSERFPGVAGRWMNLAVELAYNAFKESKAADAPAN
jgi:hypothetical protein